MRWLQWCTSRDDFVLTPWDMSSTTLGSSVGEWSIRACPGSGWVNERNFFTRSGVRGCSPLVWVTTRHSLAPWPRGIDFPACMVSVRANQSTLFNKNYTPKHISLLLWFLVLNLWLYAHRQALFLLGGTLILQRVGGTLGTTVVLYHVEFDKHHHSNVPPRMRNRSTQSPNNSCSSSY